MAIQTGSTSAVEHDWYATRSGIVGNAPLNDHKAAYFASKGFGSNATIHKPVSQMENEWLSNIGASTANNLTDLWREVCANNSIPVGNGVDECKRNFFTGIASGTNP